MGLENNLQKNKVIQKIHENFYARLLLNWGYIGLFWLHFSSHSVAFWFEIVFAGLIAARLDIWIYYSGNHR